MAEERGFFCSTCSLKLSRENDARLHYVGKKHQKAKEDEQKRRDLEQRSVFLYGSDGLTKESVTEYFKSNFGEVSDVLLKEGKSTSAIVEFLHDETARQVLTTKKHEINGHKFVAKPRVIPPTAKIKTNSDTSVTHSSDSSDNLIQQLDSVIFETFDDLINLHERMKLDENEMEKRLDVAETLRKLLSDFIDCEFYVKIYGSSVNGFGWKNSDIDLTVVFPENQPSSLSEKVVRTVEVLCNSKIGQFRNDDRLLFQELEVVLEI